MWGPSLTKKKVAGTFVSFCKRPHNSGYTKPWYRLRTENPIHWNQVWGQDSNQGPRGWKAATKPLSQPWASAMVNYKRSTIFTQTQACWPLIDYCGQPFWISLMTMVLSVGLIACSMLTFVKCRRELAEGRRQQKCLIMYWCLTRLPNYYSEWAHHCTLLCQW